MNNFFFRKEWKSLRFLYYQDISIQLQRINQYHYHQEFLKYLLIYSYEDLDDHASSQFYHKAKVNL